MNLRPTTDKLLCDLDEARETFGPNSPVAKLLKLAHAASLTAELALLNSATAKAFTDSVVAELHAEGGSAPVGSLRIARAVQNLLED